MHDTTDRAAVRTFLFTDIEGSTRTWQAVPDGMAAALDLHDSILRGAVEAHGGAVVKHTGDGVLAVFEAPRTAASAAVEAQRALAAAVPFSVRMAVTTGEARARGDDWFGPALNRCARLLDAGHGGQILVSAASAALLRDLPVDGTRLDHLGEHRLRDLPDAQPIYQLTASGLPERHPPLRTAAAPVHTLPATRTPLIGREREVSELVDLLGRTRLLTITGVGGVGKTRLAIELASRVVDRFPGGAFFAELATVTSTAGVQQSLLEAMGVGADGLPGVTSPDGQFVTLLAGRQALLVLDNCEHLLDDCADVVDAILDACPLTSIVTTSREPLSVEGEQVWRAPSLSTEGADGDAVRLFVERAGGNVESSMHSTSLITEVCKHLDGIPLAIELAASQTGHLSIQEIAARLTDRFSLLTGGRRRVQRQQTLHAAVDWSHDLLSDAERQLLRRLAVFPGWFDLAAIEAVCADGLPEETVRLLGALVGKSLVAPDARRSRYRLLETIRLYAEERLVAAREAEDRRQRHADWVFDVIERLGSTAGRTLDGIEAMTDLEEDLMAALQWSVDRGDLAGAARALNWSGTYWWFNGRHEEGLVWLDAVEGSAIDDTERTGLLGLRAALLLSRGDHVAVLEAAEAARRGDPSDISPGCLQADLIAALVLLAAPGAEERLDDIIRRASLADDPFFLRQARDYRAHLQLVEDPEAAVAEWAELVAGGDRERRGVADFFALVDLGGGRHLIGDHGGTLAAADELDRRGFSIGRGFTAASAAFLRALAAAGMGDVDRAWGIVSRLRVDLQRSVNRLAVTDCALACAVLLFTEGDLSSAARLHGAIRGTGSIAMQPISYALHRHYTVLARQQLPPGSGRRLYDEARDADPLALVDEVLGPRMAVGAT